MVLLGCLAKSEWCEGVAQPGTALGSPVPGVCTKNMHIVFFRRSTPRRKTWRKTDDREGIPQDQTGEVCPSVSYFSGKGWLHHATAKKITARGCLVISAPSTTTGLEKKKEKSGHTRAVAAVFFFPGRWSLKVQRDRQALNRFEGHRGSQAWEEV